MAAHPSGGTALAGELAEPGDLGRAGLGSGQRAAEPGHGDRHGLSVEGERAEEHRLIAMSELDARHAARGSALGAHRGGREVQQLPQGCDEDALVVGRAELDRPHEPVAVVEADDLPVGLGERHVGRDALDHAASRSDCETWRLGAERGEAEGRLVAGEGDELLEGRAASEARWTGGGRDDRELERADPEDASGRRDQADVASCGALDR